MSNFKLKSWFLYLTPWQQNLVKISYRLLEREQTALSQNQEPTFPDYSFIVFSMSKAYEGFLKKMLLDMNLIPHKVYEGRKFRIGRALNPDMHFKYRDKYWLYDDLAERCGNKVARQLWATWLSCRNRVFHFFPKDKGQMSLETAAARLKQMSEALDAGVKCLL